MWLETSRLVVEEHRHLHENPDIEKTKLIRADIHSVEDKRVATGSVVLRCADPIAANHTEQR